MHTSSGSTIGHKARLSTLGRDSGWSARTLLPNTVASSHMGRQSTWNVARQNWCVIHVKYTLDSKDLVQIQNVKFLINNFILTPRWCELFWICWVKQNTIKINFIYLFLLIFNVTTREFSITYMTHVIFLLDSTVLGREKFSDGWTREASWWKVMLESKFLKTNIIIIKNWI